MKSKHILLTAMAILFSLASCCAEDTNSSLAMNIAAYSKDTNVIWGASTNDIRTGLEIILPDTGYSYIHVPQCEIYLQNVGTNNVVFRVRYKAELRGADGNLVKPSPGQEMRGHYMPHKIPGPRPMETDFIDYFSIPEVFQVRTNGIHQLVISMQAATNKWHGELTYFDIPPVTNTFNISTNEFSR